METINLKLIRFLTFSVCEWRMQNFYVYFLSHFELVSSTRIYFHMEAALREKMNNVNVLYHEILDFDLFLIIDFIDIEEF